MLPMCFPNLAGIVFLLAIVRFLPGGEPSTSLFDGKSLTGWHQFGGKPGVWGVEDGMLISRGEGGGWIGTERDYSDFEFSTEFKLSSESNSGIYLRAPAETSHISRTGLEIQLLDEVHPRYKDIQGWQRTGAIYHVAAPKPGQLRKTGEWNTIVIRAAGPHMLITLNGVVVVDDQLDKHPELDEEHPGLSRRTGRIGLQSHNGRVEFRKIEVKDLTTLPRS